LRQAYSILLRTLSAAAQEGLSLENKMSFSKKSPKSLKPCRAKAEKEGLLPALVSSATDFNRSRRFEPLRVFSSLSHNKYKKPDSFVPGFKAEKEGLLPALVSSATDFNRSRRFEPLRVFSSLSHNKYKKPDSFVPGFNACGERGITPCARELRDRFQSVSSVRTPPGVLIPLAQ
jgi:hypothetical protein